MVFLYPGAERVHAIRLLSLLRTIFLFPAQAQSTTAESIIGRAIDSSRAIIPHTTLNTKNVEASTTGPTTTGRNNNYHFVFTEPGNYAVTEPKSGSRMIVWQADGAEAWAGNLLYSTFFIKEEVRAHEFA